MDSEQEEIESPFTLCTGLLTPGGEFRQFYRLNLDLLGSLENMLGGSE